MHVGIDFACMVVRSSGMQVHFLLSFLGVVTGHSHAKDQISGCSGILWGAGPGCWWCFSPNGRAGVSLPNGQGPLGQIGNHQQTRCLGVLGWGWKPELQRLWVTTASGSKVGRTPRAESWFSCHRLRAFCINRKQFWLDSVAGKIL